MSKTPHCMCSPDSSVIDPPLKRINNEMPSPPLPPRTLRTNLSSTKNQWEQLAEKSNCKNDKVQCNFNRPHSCPTEEGSPPIPPKSSAQDYNKSKFQINTKFDERLNHDRKQKCETKRIETHRQSRKSGRHNSAEGGKTRKKSRSKSRPLVVKEEKLSTTRHYDEERYFMKTSDNLMAKNSEFFYKTNFEATSNLKLCKISENNEAALKLCPKTCEIPTNHIQLQTHAPDLIPNRSNSTKVAKQSPTTGATDNSHKSSSKFRKFFGLWNKPKKLTETSRAITITPEASKSLKTTEVLARPRRSKSLHLISSLSPTSSMHAKSNVISPEMKTKSSSIFAVISPTTARLKRNLLCISPKASNANKKQANTLSLANNSKSILSDNSQQRPGLSSLSGVRLSPVHLLASNTESCCLDKDPNINHYNTSHFTCGNSADVCRGYKMRPDHHEKGNSNENDGLNKTSSGSKVHNHSHQDTNQRKTPQSSSQISRQLLVNNSLNQMCSCYNYRPNDNNFSCNNAYHHFCPSQSTVPTCGCLHNIVQFNPNHFHCCHGNQQVWCLVPCCSEQIPMKQHSFCSCQIYHHSASPPANFPRQLPPPPPPPPPVPSFSNNHQFSRRYRQSYSKTPPPSFHTHQLPCHDDHCYQEYNLNHLSDSRQKMILSHQIKSNTYHSNCCRGFQNKQCSIMNHSKCSACGSLFYDEIGSQATHYNLNEVHKNHCSTSPTCDSVFDHKLIPQNRVFASPINTEDSFNCRCLYNHSTQRHSETWGRHSNEMRIHSCRNSAHRSLMQPHVAVEKERSSSKRRKNSSHSCHGSNLDTEIEEKHDLSRTHHNSPVANILPTTSMHMSPEMNINSITGDMSMSTTNNLNAPNSISNIMTSSSTINQNDRRQPHFEPWRKTFHDNMMALRNLGWYWGPLNHLEAENLVNGRPDGTFLVRDSGNEAYFLSLTFRVLGTTYHTRIEYSQGKFSFWSQPESHSATTIVEFIDKAVAHSVSGKFHYFLQTNTPGQPPMEVSLLYPLSRYQVVQSLQHLSRFVILSNIRRDHVSHLELPQLIKSYLIEKQYYIDCIETFVKITKDSDPLTYEPSGRTL